MKQQLHDYGFDFREIPIKCDNTVAINFAKNPVQHFRTKHIEIKYHFICDHVHIKDIVLDFVPAYHQLANILMKPLDNECLHFIWNKHGIAHLETNTCRV